MLFVTVYVGNLQPGNPLDVNCMAFIAVFVGNLHVQPGKPPGKQPKCPAYDVGNPQPGKPQDAHQIQELCSKIQIQQLGCRNDVNLVVVM